MVVYFCNAELLFDSGSQRSFVTEDLKQKLCLKTVRIEKVVIKAFGEKDRENQGFLMLWS